MIYVASSTKHAEMWRELRKIHSGIVSTWIDEAGEGESDSLEDLWCRCIAEVTSCDVLIAWHYRNDVWKGVFVEIGAALALGIPVRVVGDPPGSWINHTLVTRYNTLMEAFSA